MTSNQSSIADPVATMRADFPILQRQVRGKPLVYLDSAATTQKPQVVIDAISDYYQRYNANVHRAAHALADEATRALEAARGKVATLLGAPTADTVVFTRGTTEAINLVAWGLTAQIGPDDEILITALEHHSNIVPWQMLAARTGARLRAVDVNANGDLDLADFHDKLSSHTALVAVGHVSNALGSVNPIAQIIADAHAVDALVLIDGAQATANLTIDVQALDCDFYACSAHKCFGPTGIGALYGRAELLDALPPWQGGGEMIETVTLETATYNRPPYKFEAGTPNIAGAIGFGAAIDYLQQLPLDALRQAESELVARTAAHLRQMPGITLVGEPEQRSGVISFVADEGQPDDIGTLLDQQGIAVRTGHHCAMPLMSRLELPGTIRASFGLYNDAMDSERFVEALSKSLTFL
ncbi:MAG: aminotransferase class V-fold PLP-dependent enzyme [Pseudomonadales bacterium]